MYNTYIGIFGTHKFTICFLYKNTFKYFNNLHQIDLNERANIVTTNDFYDYAKKYIFECNNNAYIEYKCLISLTSKKLLEFNACIFHSVSFVFDGFAWLITAPSGTGKTTQYLNWIKIFPNEIKMISGDMPIIETTETGSINVYPSPWNGKENIFNNISAPLGGIIYLEQSSINTISDLDPKSGVNKIFQQFVVMPDTIKQTENLCLLNKYIYENYPIWILKNNGSIDSTVLLRETIIRQTRILSGN